MTNLMKDHANIVQVVTPASVVAGPVTSALVDATGRSRARFIFTFGTNGGGSAALSSGLGVYAASTSGGTYTAVTGAALAAVSSGALSDNVMVIDTAIPAGKPWLKVSGGSILSTAIVAACVVELYEGVSLPPTATEQQVVVVS